VHPGWPRYLASINARMWPLSEPHRSRLVNRGYLTSDLALRGHVWKDAELPPALPHPRCDFSGPPPGAPPVAGPETRAAMDESLLS
jgi:hypothetical protein